MAENLIVEHYNNGDPIPNVTSDSAWIALTTGALCYYNNDPDNSHTGGGTSFYNVYNQNEVAFKDTASVSWTKTQVDANTIEVEANVSVTGGVTSVTATSPISSTGGTTPDISVSQSGAATDGYLSTTDWNTFNSKQAAGDYITSLTGEATATGPGAATVTLGNSSVIGKVLTGLSTSTGGSISATDSILQAFGKVQNQITGLVGGVTYQGVWDAATNTPTLTSSVGTQGYYYVVNVAGSTNLNGITDWKIGDWAIFNGTAWNKVDNTDSVSSVNGQTGAVSLTTDNISEGTTNLYYLDSRARAALSFAAGSGAYNSTSGVITIPTNTSQLTNGAAFITLGSLTASSPLSYNNTTGAFSISQASASVSGYLSSTDWTTFNSKGSGTVTSVGLSMPSAFSVGSSPVTGSGTIAVTGSGATTQYIDGTGALQTFPTIITEAQNLITDVYNETGATLTKGTVVYINGGHGNLPTITKALATSDATSAQTYGVVQLDITNNNNGHVVVIGTLSDLNTFAYAPGTQLYLSSTTAGQWTSVKQYAPAHLVYVGIVVRQHPTQGIVEVRIQNGFEMDELHNVSAQSPSNNSILQYVTSTALWTAVAGSTTNISEGTNLYYTDARARSAVSLTTTGSSGASTYSSSIGVLNVPTYTLSGLGGVPTSRQLTINGTAYDLSADRSWSVGTVTSVAALTLGTTGTDLSSTVATGTTTPVITLNVPTASATNRGVLSSTDWSTFNNKQATITLTTTGTSGAATFVANTLNIPNYADGGVLSLSAIGSTPNANAGTITGTVLNLQPASASFGGVVTTGTQTFAGAKTFSVDATINTLTVGLGGGANASNTAMGYQALSSNTTGILNTAIGYQALNANTTASNNAAVGRSALYSNTTGANNTAIGNYALFSNTTSSNNSAFAYQALYNNTTGNSNTALGYQALYYNTTGSANIGVGNTALYSNTAGIYNTALGYQALYYNTSIIATLGTITGGTLYTNGTYTPVTMTKVSGSMGTAPTATIVVSGGVVTTVTLLTFGSGVDLTTILTAPAASIGGTGSGFSVPVATITSGNYNTAVGQQSLTSNTTGTGNTAMGLGALLNNTTANYSTAVGYAALTSNTTGVINTAIGTSALASNTTGGSNVAIGYSTLNSNTTASNNTAVGRDALTANTTGGNNIALGFFAGRYITGGVTSNITSSNSVYLGSNTNAKADGDTNEIIIGYGVTGNGSNTATIGNSSITANYFTGSVNGGSFVKSGGTSAQILAADGSVITAGTNVTISGGTISATGGSSTPPVGNTLYLYNYWGGFLNY